MEGSCGVQRFRRRTDEEEWERESDGEWAASGEDSDGDGKDGNYRPVYDWWRAKNLVPAQNMRQGSRHVRSLQVRDLASPPLPPWPPAQDQGQLYMGP